MLAGAARLRRVAAAALAAALVVALSCPCPAAGAALNVDWSFGRSVGEIAMQAAAGDTLEFAWGAGAPHSLHEVSAAGFEACNATGGSVSDFSPYNVGAPLEASTSSPGTNPVVVALPSAGVRYFVCEVGAGGSHCTSGNMRLMVTVAAPTSSPTAPPTGVPTASPTGVPTGVPTASPTGTPTTSPTAAPTPSPTGTPTYSPFLPDLCASGCACFGTVVRCSNVRLTTVGVVPAATTELYLDKNMIPHLPDSAFSGAPNLRIINMTGNPLKTAIDKQFAGLTKLEELYLGNCEIPSFSATAFKDLTALKTLVLSEQGYSTQFLGLLTLPDGIFGPLPNLEILLMRNLISSIGAGAFDNNTALRILDMSLSFNRGSSLVLPAGIFDKTTALERLTFENQRIRGAFLPEGVFGKLQALQELDLTTNLFREAVPVTLLRNLTSLRTFRLDQAQPLRLPSGLFADTQQLETLSVQLHAIQTLEPGLFAGLTKLKTLAINRGTLTATGGITSALLADMAGSLTTLDLTFNRLNQAVLPTLSSAGLTSLTSLNLAGNLFTSFSPPPPAGSFPALTELNIGTNRIGAFAANTFAGLPSLTSLIISRQGVASATLMSGALAGLSNLKTLDLNTLRFTTAPIPADVFQDVPQVEDLNMQSCSITALPAGLFANLRQLRSLRLGFNLIVPGGLDNTTFADLERLELLSLVSQSTPSPFGSALPTGLLAGARALQTLDMSNVGITSVPEDLVRDLAQLKRLDLSRNKFTTLPPTALRGLGSLQQLLLQFGLLASLPADVFGWLDKVDTLLLNNNYITSLPEDAFASMPSLATLRMENNALTALPEGMTRGLTNLREMSFASNSITEIAFGALPAVGRTSSKGPAAILDMAGNPTTCTYTSASAVATFVLLQCSCGGGLVGDGSFCLPESEVGCLAGTTDTDSNPGTPCDACPPGTFAGLGSVGPCQACPGGSTDSDSNSASNCVACGPGFYVPEGSVGPCASFACPAGTVDDDSDASTPCVDLCTACTCGSSVAAFGPPGPFVVDCSGLGLTAFPTNLPAETADLLLNDNAIAEIPLAELSGLPQLRQVQLENNNVATVDQALSDFFVSRSIYLTTANNPTECELNSLEDFSSQNQCFCGAGLEPSANGLYCIQPATAGLCPAGFVDHDSLPATDCVFCATPGVFVPPGQTGACDLYICEAVHTDHDRDPATPCVPCIPGSYVPPGSFGSCDSLRCEAGSTDADFDPSTPCLPCAPTQYLPVGSAGPCDRFTCPGGQPDDDSDPATPCVNCGPGHYVPPASIGACSSFRCPLGTTDLDLLASTPCASVPSGHFAPAGSNGSLAFLRCEAGTIDHDFNSSTPCLSCDATANVFVPAGSAGDCADFACAAGLVSADAALPCVAPASIKSSSDNTGAIVGAVLGLLVLVALVLLLLLWRKKQEAQEEQAFDFSSTVDEVKKGGVVPREIPRERITMLEKLGAGAFGEVYKGLVDETTELGVPSYLVACKQFPEPTSAELKEIRREAVLMANVKDPHVAQLVGVVTKGLPQLIVLQFCEYGSLDHLLQKQGTTLLLNARLQMAHDIAAGMKAIHKAGFVHRDLAARNVLVSSDLRCKVADFGHARETDTDNVYTSTNRGAVAVRWTAPEALEAKQYSERSDVWSYGVTLYEIWTNGMVPYKGMTNEDVWLRVKKGFRLPCPMNCPRHLHKLMKQTWSKTPSERPTFTMLQEYFTHLLNGDMDALRREWTMFKSSRRGSQRSTVSGTSSTSSWNSTGDEGFGSNSSSLLSQKWAAPSPNSSPTTSRKNSPGTERRASPSGSQQGDEPQSNTSQYVDFGAEGTEEAPPLFVPEAPKRVSSLQQRRMGSEEAVNETVALPTRGGEGDGSETANGAPAEKADADEADGEEEAEGGKHVQLTLPESHIGTPPESDNEDDFAEVIAAADVDAQLNLSDDEEGDREMLSDNPALAIIVEKDSDGGEAAAAAAAPATPARRYPPPPTNGGRSGTHVIDFSHSPGEQESSV